jgi:hypothetical protein
MQILCGFLVMDNKAEDRQICLPDNFPDKVHRPYLFEEKESASLEMGYES